jgi:PAT family beta-lactamase induction signal transducer AmpG
MHLLSALATLPSNVTGAIAGTLVPIVGWARFFMITCLSAVPGLILLVVLRTPLNELSARDAAEATA